MNSPYAGKWSSYSPAAHPAPVTLTHVPTQTRNSQIVPEPKGILTPRGRQTIQDRVRVLDKIAMAASRPSITTLEKLIEGGRQRGPLLANHRITFAMEDYWQTVSQPAFFSNGIFATNHQSQVFTRAKSWTDSATGVSDWGLHSLAKHILGADDEQALEWVASVFGVPFDQCDVGQAEIDSKDEFIRWPAPDCQPPVPPHARLGHPNRHYWFTTEFGRDFFVFSEWDVGQQTVGLFCSLVQDGWTKAATWKFVQPPAETLLFNWHRIRREAGLPIEIHCHIGVAASRSTAPQFIATWAGGEDLVGKIEWRHLAKRNVTYVVDLSDHESVIVGHHLKGVFGQLGTHLAVQAHV